MLLLPVVGQASFPEVERPVSYIIMEFGTFAIPIAMTPLCL